MTDISRNELRAYLSTVETQVRASLRIVATESRATRQAHSALRADLSAALIRLQSDINGNAHRIDSKVETLLSIARGLGTQRRLATLIVLTLVLLFGLLIGLLAGGGWFIVREGLVTSGVSVPLALESSAAPPADKAAFH